MDFAPGPTYYFDDVEIDIGRGTLKRDGKDIFLRQKTFQVLTYLLKHSGKDLPKDRIIADVWQDTSVVDDVLVQSIKDIRRALDDDPHKPRFIRTLPKLGYRFIAVSTADDRKHDYGSVPPVGSSSYSPESPSSLIRSRLVLIGISAFILVAIVLGFAGKSLWNADGGSAAVRLAQTPGKKNIVVTFFENQSDTKELDWLREGLADMLITGFSRSANLSVVSRGQLHALLERRGFDPAAKFGLDAALLIAGSSGAEMVTTGSFGKLGDKVRIEVQLYDVRSGGLLASESLAVENPEMILTEIDLLSRKLISRVDGTTDATAERATALAEVMTNNLEAYRYYSLGVEKAQGLQNKEAIKLLEKAISLDPEFAMAHARIGYTYAVTWGLAAEGRPHLVKAFKLSPRLTEKDRLNIAAWYAIANLDYPSAIRSFQEVIGKYPLETEAYWRLGRLLLGEEQYDEAFHALKQGLVVDPENKDIYNALGVTYRDTGRHAEAIAATERYVLLAPQEPNAYDSLALAYQAAGQFDQAKNAYDQALRFKPDFDIAVLHLGNLHFQTGRYDEAVRSYQQYISMAVSDWDKAWGWGRIAWVNWRKGDISSASKAADNEIKLDDSSFTGSLILAIEQGDTTKAGRLKQKLEEQSVYNERGLRPSLRRTYFLRGYLAQKDGRHDEAIEHYRELLHHRPMIWDIDSFEDALANAYLAAGRSDEAIAEYSRILQANPNYPLAEFNLAQAYETAGQRDNAIASYTRFLESWKNADPDLPAVISAHERVGQL